MGKNLVSIVAIVLSIVSLSFAWHRKHIEVSSLTLRDDSGRKYAVIDANHHQFSLYNSNGTEMVTIDVVKGGANVIVRGADGFESIRLSTWATEAEGGSYIHILPAGWQDNPGGPPPPVVHISKNGVVTELQQNTSGASDRTNRTGP